MQNCSNFTHRQPPHLRNCSDNQHWYLLADVLIHFLYLVSLETVCNTVLINQSQVELLSEVTQIVFLGMLSYSQYGEKFFWGRDEYFWSKTSIHWLPHSVSLEASTLSLFGGAEGDDLCLLRQRLWAWYQRSLSHQVHNAALRPNILPILLTAWGLSSSLTGRHAGRGRQWTWMVLRTLASLWHHWQKLRKEHKDGVLVNNWLSSWCVLEQIYRHVYEGVSRLE